MELEIAVRNFIRETVAELLASHPEQLELITIEEAAEVCACGKSVISGLIDDSPSNGFPVIRLGTKLIKIDKRRLLAWLRAGGINGGGDERD